MVFFALFCAACSAPVEPKEQASGQILGGALDAPLRIEVFSDFQCPSCREFYLETIHRILEDYSGVNKVCVIYHEFPLPSHRYSRQAARYAEAASRFGRQKLLMVYDILFMEQAKWSADGNLEPIVSKVFTRPELQELKRILQDPDIDAEIDREIQLGAQRQIQSTPTYFISSGKKQERVEGYLAYPAVKEAIDRQLR